MDKSQPTGGAKKVDFKLNELMAVGDHIPGARGSEGPYMGISLEKCAWSAISPERSFR